MKEEVDQLPWRLATKTAKSISSLLSATASSVMKTWSREKTWEAFWNSRRAEIRVGFSLELFIRLCRYKLFTFNRATLCQTSQKPRKCEFEKPKSMRGRVKINKLLMSTVGNFEPGAEQSRAICKCLHTRILQSTCSAWLSSTFCDVWNVNISWI